MRKSQACSDEMSSQDHLDMLRWSRELGRPMLVTNRVVSVYCNKSPSDTTRRDATGINHSDGNVYKLLQSREELRAYHEEVADLSPTSRGSRRQVVSLKCELDFTTQNRQNQHSLWVITGADYVLRGRRYCDQSVMCACALSPNPQ